MKRFISYVITAVAMAAMVTSCVDEEEFDDSPTGNFEALWKIIDV